ncbi:pirin family protein [Noviherbaspirillum cavernae]|uniref:Pirin family protein n=1 Tax=Noviherbaspirillum cavernae TaxID=2320862 RepID=A0A418X6D8_9BURK|nr:pirin family protein [Noviherbaspirillum cavernae]RJG07946.1 pirin family protein [Noviherbaspirillum cavernae]
MSSRSLQRTIEAVPASDGAGVKLRRSLGRGQSTRLDPFLMLDEFSSDNPDDYIAGFPAHPHRGFETVTYILDGHMLHEDHLGNRGDLKSGGVQWMTAGRGIIHSEMPQQERGRLRGFQLWINLPAREKMKAAGYRDIQPDEIPAVALPGGGQAKVIAGTLHTDGKSVAGAIQGLTTDPLYLDVTLPAGTRFAQTVNSGYQALVYVFEGSARIGGDAPRLLKTHSVGVLSEGDLIEVAAEADGARFLVLAGKPLREPVAQYGPFVMNTHEEIEQAIIDYQNGKFAQATA